MRFGAYEKIVCILMGLHLLLAACAPAPAPQLERAATPEAAFARRQALIMDSRGGFPRAVDARALTDDLALIEASPAYRCEKSAPDLGAALLAPGAGMVWVACTEAAGEYPDRFSLRLRACPLLLLTDADAKRGSAHYGGGNPDWRWAEEQRVAADCRAGRLLGD